MVNGDSRKAEVVASEPKAEVPLRGIDWVQPAKGVLETYSNFINASWAPDDVRLRFGTLLPDPNGIGVNWTIEERVAVTLSWARAKDLRDLLVELIAKYEAKNGEVRHGVIP
jgi:hypothetical protein